MASNTDNYHLISPMLVYDNAPAAIEFLCRAFGFHEEFRYDMPDGKVGHAELRLGGARLLLASTWVEGGMASPRNLPAVHSQVYCEVPDLNTHFQRASTNHDRDQHCRNVPYHRVSLL